MEYLFYTEVNYISIPALSYNETVLVKYITIIY